MAYGTPADPVAGTVITVAFTVANVLDPIRWLRLLTGNADPPGSNYVVVSDSTTGTTWRKIPTDAIADNAITTVKILDLAVTAAKFAAGAVVSHLGYTPVNKSGDSMTNALGISFAAGAGADFTGATIQNTSGGNSGVFLRFVSGPSNSGSIGLKVGTSHFIVLDGNGVASLHQDNLGHLKLNNNAWTVWDSNNLDPGAITVGDTALLEGQPGSYYRARANHTGSQLAATISDLATAVAGMTAAAAGLLGGQNSAFHLARVNHTGSQLAATISNLAAAVATMAADSATTATSAAVATNALALGGSAAANWASLTVASDFAAAPTINAIPIAKSLRTTFVGNGASTARQIATGFALKGLILWEGSTDVMYIAISTTNSIRLAPAGTQGSASVHLHATDGFVVADGTVQGNVNASTYNYLAIG